MRKTLILLATSTALTAAIGVPAWSALRAPTDANSQSFGVFDEDAAQILPLILASNDDSHSFFKGSRSRHDHDDDDDHDHDDDDDDCDDGCRGGVSNPAPAGTVAPPQNGLFGSGASPKVQVN
ncbi:hypothetical protein [Thalassospira sp. MCCC 1A01428]|uniref:hypothetical protein n=1 Tax=Thalassospira sp. MCCC 1A01428 TaxID=1470575 RepID=UPI000A1E45CF|nr:hypothetical protein [Thalassospira sp. MCCC 1A01428]OSQ38674.1 hypothetical protein THS27_22005 [Thalassospira sp. MCCC 1A01428]